MKIRYILLLLILVGMIGIITDKFLLQNESKNTTSDQNVPHISRPEDFVQVKRDIQRGVFFDFDNLTKDYYLQPDFYPSYKQNSSHDYSRWGVHGYGAFPGEISYKINNFKKDQYVNFYTFIKAGDDLETFQGIELNIDDQNQNSSQFDFNITPNTVMLTPTFPERSEYSIDNRTYDWAYKLKVTITAKNDISPGLYNFKLKVSPPEKNTQRLYYTDVDKFNQTQYDCPNGQCDKNTLELRKKVYVDGGQFQADKFFDIIIIVGNG